VSKEDLYGQQAVNALLKPLSEERDICVIIAGYSDRMKEFMDANAGLRRRFTHTFDFESYSPEELIQIFDIKLKHSLERYTLSSAARLSICQLIREWYSVRDPTQFGNGGDVTKIFHRSCHNLKVRTCKAPSRRIEAQDIPLIHDLPRLGISLLNPSAADDDAEWGILDSESVVQQHNVMTRRSTHPRLNYGATPSSISTTPTSATKSCSPASLTVSLRAARRSPTSQLPLPVFSDEDEEKYPADPGSETNLEEPVSPPIHLRAQQVTGSVQFPPSTPSTKPSPTSRNVTPVGSCSCSSVQLCGSRCGCQKAGRSCNEGCRCWSRTDAECQNRFPKTPRLVGVEPNPGPPKLSPASSFSPSAVKPGDARDDLSSISATSSSTLSLSSPAALATSSVSSSIGNPESASSGAQQPKKLCIDCDEPIYEGGCRRCLSCATMVVNASIDDIPKAPAAMVKKLLQRDRRCYGAGARFGEKNRSFPSWWPKGQPRFVYGEVVLPHRQITNNSADAYTGFLQLCLPIPSNVRSNELEIEYHIQSRTIIVKARFQGSTSTFHVGCASLFANCTHIQGYIFDISPDWASKREVDWLLLPKPVKRLDLLFRKVYPLCWPQPFSDECAIPPAPLLCQSESGAVHPAVLIFNLAVDRVKTASTIQELMEANTLLRFPEIAEIYARTPHQVVTVYDSEELDRVVSESLSCVDNLQELVFMAHGNLQPGFASTEDDSFSQLFQMHYPEEALHKVTKSFSRAVGPMRHLHVLLGVCYGGWRLIFDEGVTWIPSNVSISGFSDKVDAGIIFRVATRLLEYEMGDPSIRQWVSIQSVIHGGRADVYEFLRECMPASLPRLLSRTAAGFDAVHSQRTFNLKKPRKAFMEARKAVNGETFADERAWSTVSVQNAPSTNQQDRIHCVDLRPNGTIWALPSQIAAPDALLHAHEPHAEQSSTQLSESDPVLPAVPGALQHRPDCTGLNTVYSPAAADLFAELSSDEAKVASPIFAVSTTPSSSASSSSNCLIAEPPVQLEIPAPRLVGVELNPGPVRYQGSKKRVAKEIYQTIIQYEKQLTDKNILDLMSPFVGMGAVELEFAKESPDKEIAASDINEDVILLWQALQEGKWLPEQLCTEEYYNELKNSSTPSAERGFYLSAYAFNGCFGGSFRGNSQSEDMSIKEGIAAYNAVKDVRTYLEPFTFSACSYENLSPKNQLVYCDPPYRSSLGRRGNNKHLYNFDVMKFWRVMREWSKDNLVFISEEAGSAPQDFTEIWRKSIRRNLGNRNGQSKMKKTECLFIHSSRLLPSCAAAESELDAIQAQLKSLSTCDSAPFVSASASSTKLIPIEFEESESDADLHCDGDEEFIESEEELFSAVGLNSDGQDVRTSLLASSSKAAGVSSSLPSSPSTLVEQLAELQQQLSDARWKTKEARKKLEEAAELFTTAKQNEAQLVERIHNLQQLQEKCWEPAEGSMLPDSASHDGAFGEASASLAASPTSSNIVISSVHVPAPRLIGVETNPGPKSGHSQRSASSNAPRPAAGVSSNLHPNHEEYAVTAPTDFHLQPSSHSSSSPAAPAAPASPFPFSSVSSPRTNRSHESNSNNPSGIHIIEDGKSNGDVLPVSDHSSTKSHAASNSRPTSSSTETDVLLDGILERLSLDFVLGGISSAVPPVRLSDPPSKAAKGGCDSSGFPSAAAAAAAYNRQLDADVDRSASCGETVLGSDAPKDWCLHIALRRGPLSRVRQASKYVDPAKTTQILNWMKRNWTWFPQSKVDAPTAEHYEVLLWLSRDDTIQSDASETFSASAILASRPARRVFSEGLSFGFQAVENAAVSTIKNPGASFPSAVEIHDFDPQSVGQALSEHDTHFTAYLDLPCAHISTGQVHDKLWKNGLKKGFSQVQSCMASQAELLVNVPEYCLNQFCCFSFATLVAARGLGISVRDLKLQLQEGCLWRSPAVFAAEHGEPLTPLVEHELFPRFVRFLDPPSLEEKLLHPRNPSEPLPFVMFAPSTKEQVGFVAVPYSYVLECEQRFIWSLSELSQRFPDYTDQEDLDNFPGSWHATVGHGHRIVTSSAAPQRQVAFLQSRHFPLQKLLGNVIDAFLFGFRECTLRLDPALNPSHVWLIVAAFGDDPTSVEIEYAADHRSVWQHAAIVGGDPRDRHFRNLLGQRLLQSIPSSQDPFNPSTSLPRPIQPQQIARELNYGVRTLTQSILTLRLSSGGFSRTDLSPSLPSANTIRRAQLPHDYLWFVSRAKQAIEVACGIAAEPIGSVRSDSRLGLCYLLVAMELLLDNPPHRPFLSLPDPDQQAEFEAKCKQIFSWCLSSPQLDTDVPVHGDPVNRATHLLAVWHKKNHSAILYEARICMPLKQTERMTETELEPAAVNAVVRRHRSSGSQFPPAPRLVGVEPNPGPSILPPAPSTFQLVKHAAVAVGGFAAAALLFRIHNEEVRERHREKQDRIRSKNAKKLERQNTIQQYQELIKRLEALSLDVKLIDDVYECVTRLERRRGPTRCQSIEAFSRTSSIEDKEKGSEHLRRKGARFGFELLEDLHESGDGGWIRAKGQCFTDSIAYISEFGGRGDKPSWLRQRAAHSTKVRKKIIEIMRKHPCRLIDGLEMRMLNQHIPPDGNPDVAWAQLCEDFRKDTTWLETPAIQAAAIHLGEDIIVLLDTPEHQNNDTRFFASGDSSQPSLNPVYIANWANCHFVPMVSRTDPSTHSPSVNGTHEALSIPPQLPKEEDRDSSVPAKTGALPLKKELKASTGPANIRPSNEEIARQYQLQAMLTNTAVVRYRGRDVSIPGNMLLRGVHEEVEALWKRLSSVAKILEQSKQGRPDTPFQLDSYIQWLALARKLRGVSIDQSDKNRWRFLFLKTADQVLMRVNETHRYLWLDEGQAHLFTAVDKFAASFDPASLKTPSQSPVGSPRKGVQRARAPIQATSRGMFEERFEAFLDGLPQEMKSYVAIGLLGSFAAVALMGDGDPASGLETVEPLPEPKIQVSEPVRRLIRLLEKCNMPGGRDLLAQASHDLALGHGKEQSDAYADMAELLKKATTSIQVDDEAYVNGVRRLLAGRPSGLPSEILRPLSLVVSALFLAEVSRTPPCLLSGLMLLDFVQSRLPCPLYPYTLAQPGIFTFRECFFNPIRDQHSCFTYNIAAFHPMARSGTFEKIRSTPFVLENVMPNNRSRWQEVDILARWIAGQQGYYLESHLLLGRLQASWSWVQYAMDVCSDKLYQFRSGDRGRLLQPSRAEDALREVVLPMVRTRLLHVGFMPCISETTQEALFPWHVAENTAIIVLCCLILAMVIPTSLF